MGHFIQMKTEEQKQKEARWNKSNQLEEHKLEIEECKLLWEQEQKIMFCDVSTMDANQRAYVMAMREKMQRKRSPCLVLGVHLLETRMRVAGMGWG
jgi:hypothetical protein